MPKRILIILCCLSVSTILKAQIYPPDWLDPVYLEQAELPIQRQLDTGIGMNENAWDLAAVRDARLFLIYTSLYQELGKTDREKLYEEQDRWLKKRAEEVKKLRKAGEGSAVSLDQADKQLELTAQRIKELSSRLKSINESKLHSRK